MPGTVVRARPSGGNFQLQRILGGGTDARLALEIRGYDLDDARRLSNDAKLLMEQTPGLADVRLAKDDARPELALRVDRDKAALLGLTVNQVATTVRTNIAGTQAAFYRERGREYPIVVRLRPEDRQRVDNVNDVLVSTPTGRLVQAKSLMRVDNERGPVEIERKNLERVNRVNAELDGTLGDAVDNVNARLGQLRVPRDFTVGFGAEVEEQAKAFAQLRWLLLLAVILVYAVMASQYESLRDPFIIMFSIPLASIGVVLALKLTGTAFSLQAYIGVIMLAGIVVSNAILLVDYTTTLRTRDKMPLRRGGRDRRPDAPPPDRHDDADDDPRPGADVARHRRGRRAAGPAGPRRHRRPGRLDADHAGVRADALHDLRGRPVGVPPREAAGSRRGRRGRRPPAVGH